MISPALTLFGLSVCFHALWEQRDLLVLFQCDGWADGGGDMSQSAPAADARSVIERKM